jgi:hypothetical protein
MMATPAGLPRIPGTEATSPSTPNGHGWTRMAFLGLLPTYVLSTMAGLRPRLGDTSS